MDVSLVSSTSHTFDTLVTGMAGTHNHRGNNYIFTTSQTKFISLMQDVQSMDNIAQIFSAMKINVI